MFMTLNIELRRKGLEMAHIDLLLSTLRWPHDVV